MSTIVAILEADPDGSLHLPLPPELRRGKVRVKATLEALPLSNDSEMCEPQPSPLGAFKSLRANGGLRHIISDPVEWQRQQREDRILPGRD